MSLTEINGDLFTSNDSLAHCVSKDFVMGKGIALILKSKFGKVQHLKSQDQGIGGCAVIANDDYFIYYLVTKEQYFHKPTYETLHSSLVKMKEHAIANNVKAISMPRIGCGLDRLNWEKVKLIIQEAFKDTDIKITVYTLE